MSANILTVETANKFDLNVIEDEQKGAAAVHQVVVALQANRRAGDACTKTIAEVKHSNAKPWRQKGTGRARAGLTSSPLWIGGGVVFGPKPRDYTKKTTKKTRKLALRKALSARIIAGDVLVVDPVKIDSGRTKDFVTAVAENTDVDKKLLIISDQFDETTRRAARNVQWVSLSPACDVTVEQLLNAKQILISEDALKVLGSRVN